MAGESQQVPKSQADPTVLTTEAIGRGLKAERDYTNGQFAVLLERLRGIDRATELLNETVNRFPTDQQKTAAQITAITDEKFASVGLQFRERDTRSERESRDNKVAVDAAFAAQKEAAAKQDEANQKAIDKSERATAETITKLSELFKTTTDALSDKIDDLKAANAALALLVNGAAQNRVGGQEATTERRASASALYAVVGFVVSLILAAVVVIPILIASKK